MVAMPCGSMHELRRGDFWELGKKGQGLGGWSPKSNHYRWSVGSRSPA